jgi:hypothetical protein
MDWAVRDEDRLAVQGAINAALGEYPEAIERGLEWREIARRGGYR